MSENILQRSVTTTVARNLASTTKTAPQMMSITPRFLLSMLPWVHVESGTYRVNRTRIELSKADIIRRGIELGVDYSLTVSCYQASPEGEACGHCDSCALRAAGFAAAGVPDPTRYRQNSLT